MGMMRQIILKLNFVVTSFGREKDWYRMTQNLVDHLKNEMQESSTSLNIDAHYTSTVEDLYYGQWIIFKWK